MAGFQRLVVATLHRGHTYKSIDEIKGDLSSRVMDLAPKGLPSNTAVPFLTVDESVGWRDVVYEDENLVVEDVQLEDARLYRQLVFRNQLYFVQSQVKLSPAYPNGPLSKSKKKLSKVKYMKSNSSCRQPCNDTLTLEYSQAMLLGLAFLKDAVSADKLNVLMIGVGGGALPSFIATMFPESHVTAVELDSDVIRVAKEYFGFVESESMESVQGDGLAYISQQVTCDASIGSFDFIAFDVNCPDTGSGSSCPPLSFIEDHVLADVKKLLKPDGVFVIDVVSRDKDIKQRFIATILKHFRKLLICDVNNDVNDIFIATSSRSNDVTMESLRVRVQGLQNYIESKSSDKEDCCLQELFTRLEVM